MMKMSKYPVLIKCRNCGSQSWHHLEKGRFLQEYMNNTLCDYCKCNLDGKVAKGEKEDKEDDEKS